MAQNSSKVRVSEMTQISKADDNAMLLILQNGNGCRISFSDLKKSIIEDLQRESREQKTMINDISKKQNEDATRLQQKIDTTRSELQSGIIESVKNVLDKNSSKIFNSIRRCEDKSDRGINSLRKDIERNSFSEILKENKEIQEKFDRIQEDFKKKITDSALKTEQSQEKILEKLNKSVSEISQRLNVHSENEKSHMMKEAELSSLVEAAQSQIIGKINALSSAIDKIDVSLYGLTIEDIDVDTLDVSSKQISSGFINELSAQIDEIKKQLENH